MRRKGRFILAAIAGAALLLPSSAKAGFISGHDLLEICVPHQADPVYRLKVAECRGYVLAVADTFDCATESRGFTWNSAAHTPQHALVNTVVTWLRAHPGQLGYQANGLVAAALSDAFPCEVTQAPPGGAASPVQ